MFLSILLIDEINVPIDYSYRRRYALIDETFSTFSKTLYPKEICLNSFASLFMVLSTCSKS